VVKVALVTFSFLFLNGLNLNQSWLILFHSEQIVIIDRIIFKFDSFKSKPT
jgi:hypothetical protein